MHQEKHDTLEEGEILVPGWDFSVFVIYDSLDPS